MTIVLLTIEAGRIAMAHLEVHIEQSCVVICTNSGWICILSGCTPRDIKEENGDLKDNWI